MEATSGAARGLVWVFLHSPEAEAWEVLRIKSRLQALMLALSFPKVAHFIPQQNGLRTAQEMWVLNYPTMCLFFFANLATISVWDLCFIHSLETQRLVWRGWSWCSGLSEVNFRTIALQRSLDDIKVSLERARTIGDWYIRQQKLGKSGRWPMCQHGLGDLWHVSVLKINSYSLNSPLDYF